MATFNQSTYSRRVETVPANSVLTVEYTDTKPNYFKIFNQGTGKLKCSTNGFPNAKNFDFAVKGSGSKLWAEPTQKTRLYLFNESGSPCTVSIMSFQAEFDPAALALSDMEIDLSGMNVETSMVISAFNSALPTGSNNIGNVGVTTLPALPTGSNSIGKVDVNGWANLLSTIAKAENQKDYTNALTNILEAISNIEITGGGEGGSTAYTTKALEGNATSTAQNISNPDNKVIKFSFFTNDGENDIVLTFTQADNSTVSISIKGGESLNDFESRFTNCKIVAGNTTPFRALWTVKG